MRRRSSPAVRLPHRSTRPPHRIRPALHDQPCLHQRRGPGPASRDSTLTVTRAAPTITWSDLDITYGTALSTNGSMRPPGARRLQVQPARGHGLHARTSQSLSVNFTPTDASDYTNASATVTINVEEATPTIAWSNPTDITYGTPCRPPSSMRPPRLPGVFTYNPRRARSCTSAQVRRSRSTSHPPTWPITPMRPPR